MSSWSDFKVFKVSGWIHTAPDHQRPWSDCLGAYQRSESFSFVTEVNAVNTHNISIEQNFAWCLPGNHCQMCSCHKPIIVKEPAGLKLLLLSATPRGKVFVAFFDVWTNNYVEKRFRETNKNTRNRRGKTTPDCFTSFCWGPVLLPACKEFMQLN